MFVGIGLVCVPLAVTIYKRINKKRDTEVLEGKKTYTPAELRALEDRAPDFRYIL